MKTLKEIQHEANDCANHFYNVYCEPSKCPTCPFNTEKHDCFASRLDEIYLEIEARIESIIKIVGANQ